METSWQTETTPLIEASPVAQMVSSESAQVNAREQEAILPHDPVRYYLYEYDAPQEQAMETQLEWGLDAAVETFLLPLLQTTRPYPSRCRYIGLMGWDLVDPLGLVQPAVIAMTNDKRRFLVGVADWDGERTLEAHWSGLPPTMRTELLTTWSQWRKERI